MGGCQSRSKVNKQ